MVKQKNGVYRWTYELNLYRNPTVLITVLKVLGLSMSDRCVRFHRRAVRQRQGL